MKNTLRFAGTDLIFILILLENVKRMNFTIIEIPGKGKTK